MLTPKDYKGALLVQSAVNLSGIVPLLQDVIGRVLAEARSQGKGRDYVNTHPIVRLYVEQMYFLAQGLDYHEAYRLCQERSEEVEAAASPGSPSTSHEPVTLSPDVAHRESL